MAVIEKDIITDQSQINYFEKVIGTRNIVVSGRAGIGKTTFCKQMLERFIPGEGVAAVDPFGELYASKRLTQMKNYDVNNPDLFLSNVKVTYLNTCNTDTIGTIFTLMGIGQLFLTTIQSDNPTEAIHQMLFIARYALKPKSAGMLKEILAEAKPLFIQLGILEGERKITSIYEYGAELRQIHLI